MADQQCMQARHLRVCAANLHDVLERNGLVVQRLVQRRQPSDGRVRQLQRRRDVHRSGVRIVRRLTTNSTNSHGVSGDATTC